MVESLGKISENVLSSRMNEPKPNNAPPPNPGDANSAPTPESAAPEQLSKEEQWALFEKELKESDWGHQPC
jgi:hypothetical protein